MLFLPLNYKMLTVVLINCLKCHHSSLLKFCCFLPGPPGIGHPGPQGPQGKCEPNDCTHALPHTNQDIQSPFCSFLSKVSYINNKCPPLIQCKPAATNKEKSISALMCCQIWGCIVVIYRNYSFIHYFTVNIAHLFLFINTIHFLLCVTKFITYQTVILRVGGGVSYSCQVLKFINSSLPQLFVHERQNRSGVRCDGFCDGEVF